MEPGVPVKTLFDHLEAGVSLDEFLDDFPTVTKEQAIEAAKAKMLPKGFRINPELNGKYADQPLFKDKVDRANHILETVGIPEV